MSLATNPMGDLLSCSNEDVKDILCNILNLNLLDSSREKPIVSAINCLLSSSNTRQQGLEYLNLIINNFSTEVISENALNWTNHCLVKYSGDILKEIKLITIGNIVTNAHNIPDFQKKFVSDYITKVIDMCLTDHNNPNEIAASLDTLTICMKVYSSWFGNQRGKIESFLLKFLEQRSTKLVDRAANGFLYMQQIGNAGLEGVIHKNNFSMTVSKLCATLQHLFQTFFENDPEFDSNAYNTDIEGFNFSTLECDSQKMLYVTTRRITNCLKFLMVMLRKSFPVSKEIKPEEILDVIRCGLNIHRCLAEGENTLEDYQTAVLLIDVQTQCLNLLRILIVWGQSHLILSAHIVSKLLIDTLRMSHKCPCFSSNSIFQGTVYKALVTWIRVAKSAFHSHFQNELVTHILQDILPVTSTVTLNIDMDLNNTKSKKAKRKAVQDKVISSSIHNNNESQTTLKAKHKENVCIFALNTLKQLLIATDLKIKTVLLKELYSVITGTLLDLTYSKFVHPYTNPLCQEKLYEVMVSFYEQTTSNIYPHLQAILTILNRGVAHHNLHIAITCEHGLSNLEKLCQPLYPPLYSPPGDEQQESNTVEISFQSHKEQLSVDDIETKENVYDERFVITADNVARSPVWSLETEVISNSLEADIKDNLQIQDNAPLNNKITIIQNDVISQQNEEASVSNESSNLQQKISEQNIVTNDEPCTKKIKLSLSQEENELNIINTSADIKFEKLSQEPDIQAILKSESNNSQITSYSKDSLDTASINVSENYSEIINVSTTEADIQVQVDSFEEKKVSTTEEITVQVASFEEKKVSTAEDITVQEFEEKIETIEILEDSFIDEVKNY